VQIAERWPELVAKSATVADLSYRDAVALLAAPAEPPPVEVLREVAARYDECSALLRGGRSPPDGVMVRQVQRRRRRARALLPLFGNRR
jgi:hypothetical protein